MKCYSIILSILFLAVPARAINSDYLKTTLYSALILNSIGSFSEGIKNIQKVLATGAFCENAKQFMAMIDIKKLKNIKEFVATSDIKRLRGTMIIPHIKILAINTGTFVACSAALYDLHKPNLIALPGQNKSDNKSDKDKKPQLADFYPGSKTKK